MKRIFAFLAAALGLLSAHALDVTNVTARQRWPWNNLVDVDFILTTNGTEKSSAFSVDITGTYSNGTKTAVAATFVTATEAVAGTNRVTWNLGADYPGQRIADLSLTVTASEQPDYLVIDLSGGPTAPSYPIRYSAQPPNVSSDACRTSELWLRRIPAGTFTMGSPGSEVGRAPTENQVSVTLSKGFYIGIFEVTQQQWYNVMGTKPSYFNNTDCWSSRPVEQVSYNAIRGALNGTNWPASSAVDALSFIGKLRARTCGTDAFDLPTAAQWESACRAKTTTALYNNANLTNAMSDANVALLARYAFSSDVPNVTYMSQNCGITNGSAKVGSYLPNAWGLYDMLGNELEWCLDWYEPTVTGGTDPKGPVSSSTGERVRRGGSYDSPASSNRSAFRWRQFPYNSAPTYGFRLAKNQP